jgi:hypothetical protein
LEQELSFLVFRLREPSQETFADSSMLDCHLQRRQTTVTLPRHPETAELATRRGAA